MLHVGGVTPGDVDTDPVCKGGRVGVGWIEGQLVGQESLGELGLERKRGCGEINSCGRQCWVSYL